MKVENPCFLFIFLKDWKHCVSNTVYPRTDLFSSGFHWTGAKMGRLSEENRNNVALFDNDVAFGDENIIA